MGKQKHDLGVRKRAINDKINKQHQPTLKTPSFAIGPHFTEREILHMYGPPQDVRDSAFALRQMGMPLQAQRVLDQAAFGLQRTSIPMHRQPRHDPRRRDRV